jgi:hypothetical protein
MRCCAGRGSVPLCDVKACPSSLIAHNNSGGGRGERRVRDWPLDPIRALAASMPASTRTRQLTTNRCPVGLGMIALLR